MVCEKSETVLVEVMVARNFRKVDIGRLDDKADLLRRSLRCRVGSLLRLSGL